MQSLRSTFWAAYGVALLATGVALALRALLAPWLGDGVPYITLFGAIAIAAYVGGIAPAACAALGGFVATAWLLLPASQRWSVPHAVQFAVFALCAAIIIGFVDALRRSRARLQREMAERESAESARRDQALQAARSNEAFRAIVEASPVAMVLLDPEPPIVRLWNPAAESLFGWTAAEVLGRRVPFVPDDRAAESRLYRDAVSTGVPLVSIETVRRTRDGRSIEVRLSAAPLHDADGRVSGIVSMFMDMTDARRAVAALRHSEATLRAFYDNAPVCMGVVELTADGDVRHIHDNPLACEVFGVEPGGTAGRLASELGATPDTIASWVRHYRDSEATQRPVRFEYELPGDGGHRRWFAATVSSIGAGPGGAPRFCYVTEDSSERHLAQQRQREADRQKDEFLATLSHELRNPLAPIRTSVELLHDVAGQVPRATLPLAIIDRQLGHLVRLVDDLLDLGRISAGKLVLKREPVELAKAVQHAVEASRPAIDAAGHALSVTLPAVPVLVNGDLTRLAQVVGNLLHNAAKYTPRGGRIEVRAGLVDGSAVVDVEDTGVGIPPEMLTRVFDMFTQVDRRLERTQGGLGIGLAIARRLVDMHGGTLTAASEGADRGSRFRVTLPALAAAEHTVAAPRATGNAVAADVTPRRVLVADDNQDSAESLSLVLQMMGHETRVAFDGAQALQMAADFHPDVVLLDLGMPKLNGYDVARRLRREQVGPLLLVALTGWGQDEDRRRSREAGFDLHLVKPVDPAMLESLFVPVPKAA